MGRAYYNEIDLAAAHILRAMIDADVIAPGDVDTRSIKDVQPDDLSAYTQCHFFAGGGLWSVAARLAGWPDDCPLWTGSCPCQPFSPAGKGLGTDDPRHLWPDFHRLIRACRPLVIMGEQVAGKAGYGWFDGVRSDLAREGYAGRAVDFPACSVDAPHQRNRLYWCAVASADELDGRAGTGWENRAEAFHPYGARSLDHSISAGLERHAGDGDGSGRQEPRGSVAEADGAERCRSCGHRRDEHDRQYGCSVDQCECEFDRRNFSRLHADSEPTRSALMDARSSDSSEPGRAWSPSQSVRRSGGERNGTYWSDAEWLICRDGKARRAKPGIRFLVDGLPGRVDLWRVAGNAIVPQAAAEVIAAFMEVYGVPEERAA